MKKFLSLLLTLAMLFTLTSVLAEESTDSAIPENSCYQVTNLLYDDTGAVIGVEGVYVTVGTDEDGVECLQSTGIEETYVLADGCVLELPSSVDEDDSLTNVEWEDLGDWYDEVILQGLEQEDEDVFYAFTVNIELNEDGEISRMEYVYTPW